MRFLPWFALLAFGLLPACRTTTYAYRAQRLDLDAHGRTWRTRLDEAQSVQTYSAALARLNRQERLPFDPADGLTLHEGEALALLFNPNVRVARLEARVPLLSASQAGLREDPRFEFDFLRILESVSSPWILASGLQFTLPLHGQRQAARAKALCEANEAVRAAYVAEWKVVKQLRDDWSRWSATGERIALVEAHLASVEEVLGIAQRYQEAGQIGAPRVRVLALERVTRQGTLHSLRATQASQEFALKGLMGLIPGADVALVPEFSADVIGRPLSDERGLLMRNNLELALAKAKYDAADSRLRSEIRKQHPQLELGPVLASEEGFERLGASLGISLPIWNRNRRGIVEACAARSAAKGAYEAEFELLLNELALARSACASTRARSTWIEEQVAPMADTQLADLRNLGELGDMDVLILKDALSTVLDAKLKILDARLERAFASNRRRVLIEPLRTPNNVPSQR